MQEISIRFLARRTCISASTLRYYEKCGPLKSQRNRAGKRRYPHSDIRHVSIVIIAQKCGFRLRYIKELLAALPQNRSPTAAEWTLVSQAMRAALNKKIQKATNLRDHLGRCIGCGCLSMNACHLLNAQDHLANKGAGPMLLAMQVKTLQTARPNRSGHQLISARLCHQQTGLRWIYFNLLAQTINMRFQRMGCYGPIITPHLMQ